MTMESSVKDLNILIAGGATGIGAATAKMLASRGAKVIIGDINLEGATKTAQDITFSGGKAVPLQFDITDESSISNLISKSLSAFGNDNKLDALINIAADLRPSIIGNDKPVSDSNLDPEIWQRILTVNLIGYALTTKHAFPHLLNSRGTIINISSSTAVLGTPEHPAYASSKAGIEALTRHTARLAAHEGVRCNAVSPGVAGTEKLLEAGGEKYASLVPMGRIGRPEEVASVICFLVSKEASYVTGQVWGVDGGLAFRA